MSVKLSHMIKAELCICSRPWIVTREVWLDDLNHYFDCLDLMKYESEKSPARKREIRRKKKNRKGENEFRERREKIYSCLGFTKKLTSTRKNMMLFILYINGLF